MFCSCQLQCTNSATSFEIFIYASQKSRLSWDAPQKIEDWKQVYIVEETVLSSYLNLLKEDSPHPMLVQVIHSLRQLLALQQNAFNFDHIWTHPLLENLISKLLIAMMKHNPVEF